MLFSICRIQGDNIAVNTRRINASAVSGWLQSYAQELGVATNVRTPDALDIDLGFDSRSNMF